MDGDWREEREPVRSIIYASDKLPIAVPGALDTHMDSHQTQPTLQDLLKEFREWFDERKKPALETSCGVLRILGDFQICHVGAEK